MSVIDTEPHPLSPDDIHRHVVELSRQPARRKEALAIAEMMLDRTRRDNLVDPALALESYERHRAREEMLEQRGLWYGTWSLLLNICGAADGARFRRRAIARATRGAA